MRIESKQPRRNHLHVLGGFLVFGGNHRIQRAALEIAHGLVRQHLKKQVFPQKPPAADREVARMVLYESLQIRIMLRVVHMAVVAPVAGAVIMDRGEERKRHEQVRGQLVQHAVLEQRVMARLVDQHAQPILRPSANDKHARQVDRRHPPQRPAIGGDPVIGADAACDDDRKDGVLGR